MTVSVSALPRVVFPSTIKWAEKVALPEESIVNLRVSPVIRLNAWAVVVPNSISVVASAYIILDETALPDLPKVASVVSAPLFIAPVIPKVPVEVIAPEDIVPVKVAPVELKWTALPLSLYPKTNVLLDPYMSGFEVPDPDLVPITA